MHVSAPVETMFAQKIKIQKTVLSQKPQLEICGLMCLVFRLKLYQ